MDILLYNRDENSVDNSIPLLDDEGDEDESDNAEDEETKEEDSPTKRTKTGIQGEHLKPRKELPPLLQPLTGSSTVGLVRRIFRFDPPSSPFLDKGWNATSVPTTTF